MNLACTERCEQSLLECFVGCGNDMNCVSDCIREETKCIQGKSLQIFKIGFWIFKHILDCPCEIGCLDGCDDCDNAVCQCEVRYSMITDGCNPIIKDLETNQDWNICIDDNGATLGRCIYACDGNKSCEDNCLDGFKSRQANCPCEVPFERFLSSYV